MNKEQYLLIISGPSGSGKDTVVNYLRENHSNIEVAVSATTRDMRPGEAEGENYFYISVEEFERKIKNGEVLESAMYCGNYYGTLKSEVDRRIENGIYVVLVIEVQGAANIKRIYPGCTSIFVRPPSYEELSRRLYSRGTESEEKIAARLERAVEEMNYAVDYDFIVTNDNIERCANEVYDILIRQRD
ncbi:MAG: guanylate kinase [Oscillospiraceae bacterium]